MKKTSLIVLRHASTQYKDVLIGRTDVPLSAEGKMEAERISKVLNDMGIDRIYSSPMKRCLETAEFIYSLSGIPIQTDERLREVDFGDFERMSIKEASKLFPDEWSERQRNKWESVPPKGESYKDAWERVEAFIEEIKRKEKSKKILLVTHATLMKIIKHKMLNMPLAEAEREYIRPATYFFITFS